MIKVIDNLGFPMVTFTKRQIPWNMAELLVSERDRPLLRRLIDANQDVPKDILKLERMTFVSRAHDEITADFVAGGSGRTVGNRLGDLRRCVDWAYNAQLPVTLDNIEDVFIKWAYRNDYEKKKPMAAISPKALSNVASLIDKVLSRDYPIIKSLPRRLYNQTRGVINSKGDKTLFREVSYQGQIMIEICTKLDSETIKGPLPIEIDLNAGKIVLLCGLEIANSRQRSTKQKKCDIEESVQRRAEADTDGSLKRRSPVVNLRLEAELLIFIAQTSMNLQQAYLLDLDDYRYTSHIDGYQISSYKARRSGEVLFEIFSEYRPHFEKYLAWRKEWFSDTNETRLFPLVRRANYGDRPPNFDRIRKIIKNFGKKFVGPKSLRKSRLNWFLRNGIDPLMVADSAQHDIKTLYNAYAEPNPHLAMVEISKFHRENDPAIAPPAPGVCDSETPRKRDDAPLNTPDPDCINPAGCMFCTQHRDIDSEDHVWSLASYRHLKTIELAKSPPSERSQSDDSRCHPAEAVIIIVTNKLAFFRDSNSIRHGWVNEAIERIRESDYHPMWDGFIQIQETSEE